MHLNYVRGLNYSRLVSRSVPVLGLAFAATIFSPVAGVAQSSSSTSTSGSTVTAPPSPSKSSPPALPSLAIPAPLGWPSPNEYRLASGKPGPRYWQQRADYTIAATLDTAKKELTGRVEIRYTNNSPDNLSFLWVHLEQNLYRSRSQGAAIFASDSRWGVRGFEGGISLTEVRVNGKAATYHIDDTRMRLNLPGGLRSGGGSVKVEISYSFPIPEHGSDRMGRSGVVYEIAQWYPRVAVYDDVRGWNAEPYLGQGEFYLNYGNYDFSLTVPAGYIVAATGTLQNASQVLTRAQRQRLDQAAKSDTVISIVTAEEAAANGLLMQSGTKTWRFKADNVRDVAWSAAPDYRWDATSWNGIICQALYPISMAGKAWESAAEQTRYSIKLYSEMFHPYPYPQATSVAGPVGGMEYPMFMMIHTGRGDPDNPDAIFGTLDHEHGHSWFPMMVGTNERRYAWFDEGLNMYMNTFALERRYKGTPAEDVFSTFMRNWRSVKERGIDVPLMTVPDRVPFAALGAIVYRKPAALFFTLRNHIVGPAAFDQAMKEFIHVWAFKHPTPYDFFRFVEAYHGADLSWYWRAFWYTNNVLDIAVDGVTAETIGDANHSRVTLRNKTGVPFPVTLRIKLVSGGVYEVTLPVEIWANSDTFVYTYVGTQSIVGVRIFPDPTVPDWDESNNVWGDAPEANPRAPVSFP